MNKIQIEAKTEGQQEYIDLIKNNKIVFCEGPAGSGKAAPLDSIVYTENGPIKMGDIKIGHKVLTPNGDISSVIGIYPQGIRDIYKISFKDGSYVECCAEHLWEVYDSICCNTKIVNTSTLLNKYKTKSNKNKYHIRLPKPVAFKEKHILIDPYLLGVILGDGGITTNITITSADEEIINSINEILPKNHSLKRHKTDKYSYRLTSPRGQENIILNNLKTYKLQGLKSYEKFIPKDYIYNTINCRISVLQGLLDTDGSISINSGFKKDGSEKLKSSHVEYTTTSKQLSKDIKEIIESLGGICKITERYTNFIHKDVKKQGRLSYRCSIKLENFELFKLSRKQKLLIPKTKYIPKRIITNIEFSRTAEAQCIKIASKDELYLMDNFVVTHNTFIPSVMALSSFFQKKYERIIISRPLVQSDSETGYLPGNLDEKMEPYMRPIVEVFGQMINKGELDRLFKERWIEIAPLGYLRGRTFNNCFIIFDEMQNADYGQLLLAITRFGKGSKMILTGDAGQSDLRADDKAFIKMIDSIDGIDEIGIMRLTTMDIVREPIVKKILERVQKGV